MNEPVNTSIGTTNFSGKSHNNHPGWYNEPLRLTKEQKDNPALILQGFFESYHLHEVREMLWEWLVEVISSRNSISNEGIVRNNHIYFYEKLEQVLEACFVLQKESSVKSARNEKAENKEQSVQRVSFEPKVNELLETDSSENESGAAIEFNKPEPLIEKVKKAPIYVINQVFYDQPSYESFQAQLQEWVFVALATELSVYDDAEQRDQLISFHKNLKEFIEGLYILQDQANIVGRQVSSDYNKIDLAEERISISMIVFRDFFNEAPMPYIRRELYDWLEAGLSYTGDYPDSLNKLEILHLYQNTLCLIHAGYQVYKYKQAKQQHQL
jgi:hypothetical protein